MSLLTSVILPSLIAAAATTAAAAPSTATVRFATLNAAMGLASEGELARRLQSGDDPGLKRLAEVLQRVRPDVVLLTEMDYQAGVDTAGLLQRNYLSHPADGLEAVEYAHHYSADVNTGVDSGLDLDGDGKTGGPGDAWGFGRFPGQYGMLVLSRYPLDADRARSFRLFRWQDMPGALQPVNPDGSAFYPDETWAQIRLSSKSHWDLPVLIGDRVIHLLASHPTPPAFDGPEDRNGRRNHDEIRLWADYIEPERAAYLVDDDGTPGGLPEDSHFVIAGDLNADPNDGGSHERAIRQLLENPRVNATKTPVSAGAAEAAAQQGGKNTEHQGDSAADTSDFGDEWTGNLRVDYVLPSATLETLDCGVFWPATHEPGHEAASFSDHRMVWVDVSLPVGDAP